MKRSTRRGLKTHSAHAAGGTCRASRPPQQHQTRTHGGSAAPTSHSRGAAVAVVVEERLGLEVDAHGGSAVTVSPPKAPRQRVPRDTRAGRPALPASARTRAEGFFSAPTSRPGGVAPTAPPRVWLPPSEEALQCLAGRPRRPAVRLTARPARRAGA